jgi:hypothetical protein
MENKVKSSFPKYVKPYVTAMIILGVVVLLVLGAVLIWISFDKANLLTYYMLREVGKAIFLTALVSTTVNLYFNRQLSVIEKEKRELEKKLQGEKEKYELEKDERFRQTVNRQLDTLREDILNQTAEIASEAVSFDALQASDVNRFYRSRSEASESIRNALLQEGVSNIKLIGISLNDFMRDEHPMLHDAWTTIRKHIEEDTTLAGTEKLVVQTLVIDPRSSGAYWRAKAEGTEGSESRLSTDVSGTIRDFLELEQKISSHQQQNSKVTFMAKAYRTCPILFLVWTPYTAFVQSYHFRPRHTKSLIPIIKYHNSGEPDCIHQELGYHFDWIWKNASISLEEYIGEGCVGVSEAVREANISNMFYNYNESRYRIIQLIKNTKKTLWIKGISLHSYFTFSREDLFSALADAYERGVDVRVLLMDPNGEQAKLRSFREYLMSHPTSQLEHFDEKARKNERLFTDTTGSISFIRTQLRRRIKPNIDLNIRLYKSGPECFTLLTDDAVLVEQYHYGKIVDVANGSQPGLILGGDVPVTEYRRVPPGKIIDIKKDPYQLFKDSFDYVFNHCSIELNEYKE